LLKLHSRDYGKAIVSRPHDSAVIFIRILRISGRWR